MDPTIGQRRKQLSCFFVDYLDDCEQVTVSKVGIIMRVYPYLHGVYMYVCMYVCMYV